MLLKIVNIVEK